jgi:hypothetical protein
MRAVLRTELNATPEPVGMHMQPWDLGVNKGVRDALVGGALG